MTCCMKNDVNRTIITVCLIGDLSVSETFAVLQFSK